MTQISRNQPSSPRPIFGAAHRSSAGQNRESQVKVNKNTSGKARNQHSSKDKSSSPSGISLAVRHRRTSDYAGVKKEWQQARKHYDSWSREVEKINREMDVLREELRAAMLLQRRAGERAWALSERVCSLPTTVDGDGGV